jgi:hypothetical protein
MGRASKTEVRNALRDHHDQIALLKDAITADDAEAAAIAFEEAQAALDCVGDLLADRYPDAFEDDEGGEAAEGAEELDEA